MQLTDSKGRLHTITLAPGKQFHTHRGYLQHDELIGAPDGSTVTNTAGFQYLALRPLLSDYVMSMPRGAAIVYPKDAGQIIASADIALGQRVVEAGVGSGALTLWLLRAVGETGTVHSVERRQEFADRYVAPLVTEAHSLRLPPGDVLDLVRSALGRSEAAAPTRQESTP